MLLSSEESDVLVCAPTWVDRESMMSEISKLLKSQVLYDSTYVKSIEVLESGKEVGGCEEGSCWGGHRGFCRFFGG